MSNDIQYYPYKYFSGANITVEVDDDDLLECAGISFVVNESNQPVYGYASNLYDAVIPGRRVIQGSFVVNFTTTNDEDTHYLLGRNKYGGNSFVKNSPLFNIKVNYGLGRQKKESYILSNCFLISQGQTIQISENVILEEYSFIARDIFVEERIETTVEGKINEVTPTKAKNLDYSKNKYEYELFDPRNNESIFTISLTQGDIDIITSNPSGRVNYDGKEILINEQLIKVFSLVEDGSFGSIESIKNSVNATMHRTYPDNFYQIVFVFASYINKDSTLDEYIGKLHSSEQEFINNFYETATLTWTNKTTGK